MSELVGQTLGHYRIVEKIGAGGMGEVYRAQDERLERDVAIKVLPEEVAQDPERLARFEREAKLLASLSHQNIATLHGLEEYEGQRFLVMEVAKGETLAERFEKGPLPLDNALEVARQIAEGLEAAHGHGIIHRDLKPANVMLSPEGKVKVLDFGLAKAFDLEASSATSPESIAESPTLTAELTRAGTVLGTAAYMSPEQARGREVDRQTDIWALGVVLYEMLTGGRAFAGDTAIDTIAAIVEREPDWEALPAEVPPSVRGLLRRCLQKERARRLRDIADARLELEDALLQGTGSSADTEILIPVKPSPLRSLPWLAVAGLVGALLGIIATARMIRGDFDEPLLPNAEFSVDLAEGTALDLLANPAMAISPDGQLLVWAADGSDGEKRLYLRELGQSEARPLQGTENAEGPFFSPDGRWIAYFDRVEAQLKMISVEGGRPTRICDAPHTSKGGTWGDRGEIVFSRGIDGGLFRVSADGGTAERLTEPDRSTGVKTHCFPQFIPGFRAVLFMVGDSDLQEYSESRIEALNLDSGERKLIIEGGMSPRYASSGHLIFARQGTLMAAPFDADILQLTDRPKQVLEGVVTSEVAGFAEYALAPNGFLLYAPGGPESYNRRLVRADRRGRVEALPLPERYYSPFFEFSPDGHLLAITVQAANDDVWLWDQERRVLSRLTAGWNNFCPIWSPNSRRIIFSTDRRTSGANDFYWRPADRSSPSTLLYQTSRVAYPSSWSPDGRFVAYIERDPETTYDIWVLPIDENMQPGTTQRIIASKARELNPRFSPDGRWLVYSSTETGSEEIYAQPFPGPGPRQQVSSGGGVVPRWGPRGDEIFYVDPTSTRMMRASVHTTPQLSFGVPEALFPFESTSTFFELSPDGEHFVFLQRGSQAQSITQLRIVFNWFDQLERLVPTDEGELDSRPAT
jgi:serine/threonine-protein kinase